MKRIHALLALVLIIAVGFIILTPADVLSETDASGGNDGASGFYENLQLPVSYDTQVGYPSRDGATVSEKAIACSFVSSANTAMMIEADFLIYNREPTENEWSAFSEKFEDCVLSNIKSEGMGAIGELPNRLMRAVEAARGANAEPSLWTSGDIALIKLKVTYPYYVELSNGMSGTTVMRLQERLIQLGFLDGSADGHFGPKTKKAVEEAQAHVRAIEQKAIDAETPAPVEGEETQQAPLVEPETAIDGVASVKFQALLFSDHYPAVTEAIGENSAGDTVTRLQRRLISMGYMLGAADGSFGANTKRGILLFQTENGLTESGDADQNTLSLLFSGEAKTAEYPLMGVGSTGEEVKKLQTRLRDLGFMTGSADGTFGESTRQGVETLQTYLREQEINALREEIVSPARPIDNDGSAENESGAPMEIDESKIKTQVNGIADTLLLKAFYDSSFNDIPAAMKQGDKGLDVMRVQRRLNYLEYIFGGIDGDFGGGTAEAIKKFQSRNDIAQTGEADRNTLTVLFSDNAKKALKPYVLKVSIADQRVYAYGLDKNNEHTVLVRTMKCSTGLKSSPTITGTFQSTTGPGARWHYFKKFDCWAQYAYYIQGDYLFHSVLYAQKNGSVTRSSVNNLGRRASHGCVRLKVEDAKWIYNNCPRQTKVVIY